MSWQDAKSNSGQSSQPSTGVQSVSGHYVDNADPLNPVIIRKAFFIGGGTNPVTINSDNNNPSFLTDFEINAPSNGFAVVSSPEGSVINNTGRTLDVCAGTISFQPDKSGGGTTSLNLFSERSADGIAWTQNSNSLRTLEIANNGETFKTSVSAVTSWAPGELVRFRVYVTSGGNINFNPPTATVLNGVLVTGASWVWELAEL